MRIRGARLGMLLGVVLLVGMVVACGGDDDEDEGSSSSATVTSTKSAATTAAATSTATTSAGSAVTAEGVEVTLNEWSVKPGATKAKAGDVTFKVTNKGATLHELAVFKTDLAADKLPQASGAVDEKAVPPVGRSTQLIGGKSETKTFKLSAGKYVLLCNIPAHYGQGMHTAFTVE